MPLPSGREPPWNVFLWFSNLLSLVGSACMIAVCLCLIYRVGGVRRTPLFVRQLLSLSGADFLWAAWWFHQTGALLSVNHVGDPDDCLVYMTGLRFLQMLSIMSTVHIAAGLLAALSRRERLLHRLASTQLLTVPAAFAGSSVFLVWRPSRAEQFKYCMAHPVAEAIFSGEVLVAFFTTAVIHAMATRELLHGAPGEVAFRSIQRAVHYLAVFLLCWSVFVGGCFTGYMGSKHFGPDGVDLWHDIRDTLSSASGALNAAVYAGQNWRLIHRYLRTHYRRRRRGRRRERRHSAGAAGSGVRVSDGSVGSTPSGTRCHGGILASSTSFGSTPQRPSLRLAPPAWRGVAFSASVLNGEPPCLLVTPRTEEASASAEAQIDALERSRSWLLLGADPLLLHPARLLVRGAGCGELDGLYLLADCQEGRPAYRSTAGHTLRWDRETDEWQFCLEGQHLVYYQEDDAPSPPATGWLVLSDGDLPAPSVSPAAPPAASPAAWGPEHPSDRGQLDSCSPPLQPGARANLGSIASTEGSTEEPSSRPGRSVASTSDACGEAPLRGGRAPAASQTPPSAGRSTGSAAHQG